MSAIGWDALTSRQILAGFLGLGLMLSTPAVRGDEEPPAASPPQRLESAVLEAQTLDEIERLRAEIAELLASVPPALRDKVLEALLSSQDMPAPGAAAEGAAAAPEASSGAVQPPLIPPPIRATPPQVTSPSKARASRRPLCNSLDAFDENGDGKVNAQDRYWRHLHLWIDGNRDGQRQEKEIQSAYGAGVREISTRLDVFYGRKGSLGEIRIGEGFLFDLGGDGFGDSRRPNDGLLLVDAEALGRGDGPQILDGSGHAVTVMAPFAADWTFRWADGSELKTSCPGLGGR